jgi:hypothetical protein
MGIKETADQDTRDFLVENHGSIVLIQPLNLDCDRWLKEHTDGMWWGAGVGALVVEPRYVDDLVYAMKEEGFVS